MSCLSVVHMHDNGEQSVSVHLSIKLLFLDIIDYIK